MRTEKINVALERTLSRERLQKYLAESSGNLDLALALYERNVRLSEALYAPLQTLEVCLRNSINEQMRIVYGLDWITKPESPLLKSAKDEVREVVSRFENSQNADLVADLSFSFWVSLLGQEYDSSIWRNAVYKAFLECGGKPRRIVHSRMNALRRFRNRVAHHEPIYSNAEQMYFEIIETIGWMCSDTKAWTIHHSRFADVSRM